MAGKGSSMELAMKYNNIPLSKRLQMAVNNDGTKNMTKNNQFDDDIGATVGIDWSVSVNIIDPNTGYTPLMRSAEIGHLMNIKVLLNRGAEINFRDPLRGRTPLIMACKMGHTPAVELLLHRGAVINYTDEKKMNALMFACKGGHLSTVIILLRYGIGINLVDDNGMTAVHYAAKNGHKEIIKYLAIAGAALSLREDLEGKTPLILAAQYGRRETIDILIQNGASVNAQSSKDQVTGLMMATKEGHKGTAAYLISQGADANLFDMYGWTALHFAASWGRKDTAHLLLTKGKAKVNPKLKKGWTTPLIVASKGSQIEVLKLLLQFGALIDMVDMKEGKSALQYASEAGLGSAVEVLVDNLADVNARSREKGVTPLMMAAANGHEDVLVHLLNKFADLNMTDRNQRLAFDYANDNGYRDVFLSAMLRLTPAGKANIIPWIEAICPSLVRGSKCGGPSVYLNSLFYGENGIAAGLMNRGVDCDVYLFHCLVMVIVTCRKSIERHPLDAPDLRDKIKLFEEIAFNMLESKALYIDQNMLDVLLIRQTRSLFGPFQTKYLAPAFITGPLALCIEYDIRRLLQNQHFKNYINTIFFTCMREAGPLFNGFGNRTVLLRLRYVPGLMFIGEGLSKFITLIFIAMISSSLSTALSPATPAFSGLIIMWVSLLYYEYGQLEEKRWAVCPSIIYESLEWEKYRWQQCRLHFFKDGYKLCDLASLFLIFLGLLFQQVGNGSLIFISCSAIPMSIGLLRYPATFSQSFGSVVFAIFTVTASLWPFILVLAASGLGFGIALRGLFGSKYHSFETIRDTYVTLFDAMLTNYDLDVFEVQSDLSTAGIVIMTVFVLWMVNIFSNIIVGYMANCYPQVIKESEEQWVLIKARQAQQFVLAYERSPACMVPAPLNLLLGIVHIPHVFKIWKARLHTEMYLYCDSLAGSVADRMLALLFAPIAAIIEYIEWSMESTNEDGAVDREFKILFLLGFPIGFIVVLFSLFVKIFQEPAPQVILKSRMADGRLRLRYGDGRDFSECVGFLNTDDMGVFDDETLCTKGPDLEPQIGEPLTATGSLFISSFDKGDYAIRKKPSNNKTNYSYFDKNTARQNSVVGVNTKISPSPMLSMGTGNQQFGGGGNTDMENESMLSDDDFGDNTKYFEDENDEANDFTFDPDLIDMPPKSLPHISIHNAPNRYRGLFQDTERKKIFSQIIPEMFKDDLNSAIDKFEESLNQVKRGIIGRLGEVERRQEIQYDLLKAVAERLNIQ